MPMHLYQEIGNRIYNYIMYVDDLNLVETLEELTKNNKIFER